MCSYLTSCGKLFSKYPKYLYQLLLQKKNVIIELIKLDKMSLNKYNNECTKEYLIQFSHKWL
jgi:hypothetical protein